MGCNRVALTELVQIPFSGEGVVRRVERLSMKKLFLAAIAFIMLAAHAQAAERRIALVVGNANYQTGALPTPANDAGLVAQTLQAAGFDVTGARDLDQDSMRRAFRDFIDKASASGPDAVAFVYLSGYGLQLEGENYFVPIDARITSDANVPSETLRLSDFTRPLAALRLKAMVVTLDMARANPFAQAGTPLSSGLALVDPEPGTLIAFNAAPGTVAPDEAGPYSAYAQALAETMREGGVALDDVFARVRLRVNQTTNGAEVPWDVSKLQAPLYLFERAADAPPPQVARDQTASIRTRPIRDFAAADAYLAALDRDTLAGYEDFLAAYPGDPMAPRVRAIVAARREAITWRRTRNIDTREAYWSYLRRYRRGAHCDDARRRLAYLSAAFEPPPSFAVVDYDVPPPPPDEVIYVERPVLAFDDPDFDFAPPPPPPLVFLPPPPVYFVDLPPPQPPLIAFVLPVPEYLPVPDWVVPPPQIDPPPNNIIYTNIHNQVVINNTTNVVTITNPQGQTRTIPAAAAAAQPALAVPGGPLGSPPSPGLKAGIAAAGIGAAGAAAVLAPSLPPALARKAAVIPNPQPVAPARPLAPGGILRARATAPQSPATGAQPPLANPPLNAKPGLQPPPQNARQAPPGLPRVAPAQGTPAGATGAAAPAGGPPAPKPNVVGRPLPGAGGAQPLPALNGRPPATTALPPAGTPHAGGKGGPPAPAASLKSASPSAAPASPPAAKLPQPPAAKLPAATPPAQTPHSAPPAAAKLHAPPPAVHAAPPAPAINAPAAPAVHGAPPAAAIHAPPQAPAIHAPPPAAAIHAPLQAPAFHALPLAPAVHAPPPAAAIHAPPQAPAFHAPPVAPAFHAPPPAQAFHAPSPPPAARAAAPPAARPPVPPPASARPGPKGCVLPNGQPCH